LAALAETQAQWLLAEHQIDFSARLQELLARDPTPHRTRRIRKRPSGGFEIGCGAWRATFRVASETVTVTALETGYPLRFLNRDGYETVPDRDAQLAFLSRWPETSPKP
jgi:hypothetical protein